MSFIESQHFINFIIGVITIIIGLIQLKLGVALGYFLRIVKRDKHRIPFYFYVSLYLIIGSVVAVASIVLYFS